MEEEVDRSHLPHSSETVGGEPAESPDDDRDPLPARPGVTRTIVLLAVGLVLIVVVATLFGPTRIGPWASIRAMARFPFTAGTEAESVEESIVVRMRLPRVILGVLVGGGLAATGAVMQGIFRNPMADPGLVGLSGGASFGAVLMIALAGWKPIFANYAPLLTPLGAFIGGVTSAFLVYRLATIRGRTSMTTLILGGVAIGGMASALTSFVLSLSLPTWEVGRQMVYWLMGGLDAKTWREVMIALPPVALGLWMFRRYARDIDVLSTGEESAMSLGVDVQRVRRRLLIHTSLVAAITVAVAGTIVFVGLLVPHLVRLVIGPSHRPLIVASFLAGGILLVAADLVARAVIAPEEIRIGVVTSMLGGPFFLGLIVRQRSRVEMTG
jgi:iron complex transport system permease protein